ncbi:MAG: S8 family serine peptidase [Myxococcota bacterium]
MRPLMGSLRAILALLLTAAAAPALASAPVPPGLAARAAEDGRVRVIVRLDAPVASEATEAARDHSRTAITRAANAALSRIGGGARADVRRYRSLPLLALEASPHDLAELSAASAVLSIEEDRMNVPSVAESIPRVGADVSTDAGFDGSGTAIVVVDTGVEITNAYFGGRVVEEACFSAGRDCPNGGKTQFGSGAAVPCTYASSCWHGTHVAGIAAGWNATVHGVAPAASLIAIQVGSETNGPACGEAGSPCVTIASSDAIAAIDYVVDTLSGAYGIAAVNMSFGTDSIWDSEASCDSANSSYEVAIRAANDVGITSVASSGNSGSDAGIAAPACISGALGVGASYDWGDVIWSGSNSGPPLDFLAPGMTILSSMPGGGFSSKSGTSMAAPHVAGALAQLRQADSEASTSTLKLALEDTGVPITDPGNSLVRPRIQVDDAVRSRAPAACFDGLDNDSDGFVDVDGDGGAPDPQCNSGFDNMEAAPVGCGMGPELALLVPLLGALRPARRRRNRSAA